MATTIQLRFSQHLALTPQLQQSIRLLQLSTLELNQEIEQALLENPLLEREDDPLLGHARLSADGAILDAGRGAEAPAGDDAGGGGEAGESGGEVVSGPSASEESQTAFGDEAPAATLDWGSAREWREDDDEPTALSWAAAETTLHDHLRQQLTSTRASERDRVLVGLLIDEVHEDGYLRTSLEDIQTMFDPSAQVELDELTAALSLLQSFDPVGVAARTLSECLRLQIDARLRAIEPGACEALREPLSLSRCIVTDHLQLFSNRDFVKLRKLLPATDEQLRAADKLIHALNPRPGVGFATAAPEYVVADVLVKRVRSRWTAQLNPEVMPKLHVSKDFEKFFKQNKGQARSYDKSWSVRRQEANWLIRNLRQRFQTIQRVSQAIVDRQSHFFSHGAIAMRPLVLREIADAVGLHESTVSRVTANKYMATPFGVFELRYFFGSHVATDAGGAASSTAIRELIKQMVDGENPDDPLSDSAIADLLGKQGIVVARRTVAKYRELLHIAPVARRKRL
jgi:RNA polymerase sigma-54 factor